MQLIKTCSSLISHCKEQEQSKLHMKSMGLNSKWFKTRYELVQFVNWRIGLWFGSRAHLCNGNISIESH